MRCLKDQEPDSRRTRLGTEIVGGSRFPRCLQWVWARVCCCRIGTYEAFGLRSSLQEGSTNLMKRMTLMLLVVTRSGIGFLAGRRKDL